MTKETIIVTGGAGFIGSNFINRFIDEFRILNVDNLTTGSDPENLSEVEDNDNYSHIPVSINDFQMSPKTLHEMNCVGIIHFAAESHVDRSITDPLGFVKTNVDGTANLLEVARAYINEYPDQEFRFHHVSTDEVFGDLELHSPEKFSETTPYDPSSPYSASKAGSDHLVRAYHRTYGLNVTISNCSNNYGLRQFPEKLIPVVINRAYTGQTIGIYGMGENVREWIHVNDHNDAVMEIFTRGMSGETYCIGSDEELSNNVIVNMICDIMDEMYPKANGTNYRHQIEYIADRAGHDLRYAIDSSKIRRELEWSPKVNFIDGLKETIKWYVDKHEN